MATVNIFVSFEFDRDNDVKRNFYQQAKKYSSHRIGDCSLKEAYPTQKWRQKARKAIEGCDIVIILIGPDTHNACGVKTELRIARRLGKPVFQVQAKKRRNYGGVAGVKIVRWRWKRINREIDARYKRRRRQG